jgi:hypothetical protein
MSVLNGEPSMLSKKLGIPFAIFIFSASIWAWFIPDVPMMVRIFSTIMFPIASLMILVWTKFKDDKK